MKKFIEILFYLSSYIPLCFLITVKEILQIINGNISINITNTIMLIFNLTLIILGVIEVLLNYKKDKYEQIEIIEINNITSQSFLSSFSLFVLFAIAFELEYISMAVVYVFVLIIIGLVYIKNRMYYINPFLNIIGFSVYETTFKDKKGEIKTKRLFGRIAPQTNAQVNTFYIKK